LRDGDKFGLRAGAIRFAFGPDELRLRFSGTRSG
jgi:hypothetical protein